MANMRPPTADVIPGATSLVRSDESALGALYRAAIGPVNSGFYLPIFERFEAAERAGPGWNWAACLCTLNWMVMRQLWGAALVYAAVVLTMVLVLLGLGHLVFDFSDAARL